MNNFLAFRVVLPYGASLFEGRIGGLVNWVAFFSNLIEEHFQPLQAFPAGLWRNYIMQSALSGSSLGGLSVSAIALIS